MPELRRPGAVEIHWEERGKGPTVLFAGQFWGYPATYEGLLSELSKDHRVATYDLRGTGSSSRIGPYEPDVDRDDLLAVAEVFGPVAVLLTIGDGAMRSIRAAAARPELIGAVLTPGGSPIGRRRLAEWAEERGVDALASSDSVIEALLGMMRTDFRGALRVIVSGPNPQLSEDEVRERVDRTVAHCEQDAATARLENWVEDEATEEARSFGDRLWILEAAANPWFPPELADLTRELLPEAHIEPTEDGPLSRPDIAAAVVRRITAGVRT